MRGDHSYIQQNGDQSKDMNDQRQHHFRCYIYIYRESGHEVAPQGLLIARRAYKAMISRTHDYVFLQNVASRPAIADRSFCIKSYKYRSHWSRTAVFSDDCDLFHTHNVRLTRPKASGLCSCSTSQLSFFRWIHKSATRIRMMWSLLS